MIITIDTNEIEKVVREAFLRGAANHAPREDSPDACRACPGDSQLYAAKVVRELLAKQPHKLHHHVALHDGTDACARCGLDLRNEVHARIDQVLCAPCELGHHSECIGPGCACFEAGDVPKEFILHPIKIAHAGVTKEPS